ncbi:glycerol-3-phosphate dehydrogenase/oxidase [Microbacteriaceae bacterium VKM Ac-2855]|nr:glycerol-3-phosphate dehydrogenase/oxidase [Microbacteriaceae bacterium VKM Ac-2855]
MATSNDPTQARASVQALRDNPRAKVLVIGGGINGIGTFRELALNGVDVALVERGDFVSGASSASSHMIHGGIRYLENGEFRLVNEGVHERNGLLKIAPHYVKPLQTTIPIYSTFSGIVAAPLRFLTHKSGKPQERGALLIKVGLTLYDFFSRDGGTVPRHQFHGRKRSLNTLPKLDPHIKYTATYFDASVHEPERLALDVLGDALATGKGRAANYVEAVGADETGVVLRDRETGEEFTFAADVVVNVSGSWTDFTNKALGKQTKYMGGTKGSHIVLDNPELVEACEGREMFFEHSDGRIVLIYPLKGRVMIGTTDIDADPSKPVVCTEEEVDYFFELVNHVFPTIKVEREQIVFRFSGIRPLPRHDDEAPGFVSRDYRIEPSTLPQSPKTAVLSLVGGKWTTFRALSEHMSNEVFKRIGVTRKVFTAKMAIGGGKGYPRTEASRAQWIEKNRSGLSSARTGQLLERYGTRAAAVIDALADGHDEALDLDKDFTTGEIRYLATHEHVVHLIDLVMRRTNHAFTGGLSKELLDELAQHTGDVLGWSEEKRAEEVAATMAHLTEFNGVDFASPVVNAPATAKV